MDRSRAAIDRHVEALVRLCHEAGMNVTPQRLAVYRALLESEDHPSPEALYQRVKRKLPSLSLATIYKALDALSELGLVSEVASVGAGKRYDANREPHHHLVCTRCHKVADYYDAGFDRLQLPHRLDGFVALDVAVQVKGLCAACARGRARRSRDSRGRG